MARQPAVPGLARRALRAAAPPAFALAASGCAADILRPVPPEAPTEVRVEMRFAGGLPLVEGRLGGGGQEGRAWFLIDTGAGDYTLLDERLTTAMRLRHELVRDPLLPGVNFSTRLDFLEVDGMGRRGVTAHVTDALSGRAELAALGVPVQGVLGTGYFRGECLELDFARGEFTAKRPRVRHARHVAIPLRYGIGGDLHATVHLNGIEAEALVDTGAARTLVGDEFAARIGVAGDRSQAPTPRETSIGLVPVREATVERLSLGTEDLRRFPLLVVERRLPHADLVLGNDALSRYGVILDLSEKPYLVLDPRGGRTGEGAAKPP